MHKKEVLGHKTVKIITKRKGRTARARERKDKPRRKEKKERKCRQCTMTPDEHSCLRISLNRSQYGGCSTKYSTSTSIQVVYGLFNALNFRVY